MKLQILDLRSCSYPHNLFSQIDLTSDGEPTLVTPLRPQLAALDIELVVLPIDQIDLNQPWIVSVLVTAWTWRTHLSGVFTHGWDDRIIQGLTHGHARVILNHQQENHTANFFEPFYNKFLIWDKSIPADRITYWCGGSNVVDIHTKWVKDNHIPLDRQINVGYVNHGFRRFFDHNIKFFTHKNLPKIKKYLCLNRHTRFDHRLLLVSLLAQAECINNAWVSLGIVSEQDKLNAEINILTWSELFGPELEAGWAKIRHRLPLQIDTVDLTQNHASTNSLSADYYHQSCFSVVTSTTALKEDEESISFTEKEFKAILAHHPFILVNRPGALKSLRDQGYLTFTPWFNEDYDLETDDVVRLKLIVAEVKRLSELSWDEWAVILREMQPVLEHNWHRLTMGFSDQCYYNSDLKELIKLAR